ncbi:hypothetical protein PMAYCL1PPCAC_14546, partial [Pristionchus mayeri]
EKAKKRCDEKWVYMDCDVCGTELREKLVVTTHFISEEHIEKVRPLNASVSRPAVSSWVKTLEQIAESHNNRKPRK